MKSKTYFLLCVAIVFAITVSILFIPGLADTLESWLLRELSNNARVVI